MSDFSVFARRESGVRYYCRKFPAIFQTAFNDILVDDGGRRYIDFFSAAGALNYGHNHPKMAESLVNYIGSNGVCTSLDLHTGAKQKFLEEFEAFQRLRLAGAYRLMFPGPTGANAVEAALKLARKATGRSKVAAFTNGFHGMSLGALAVTGARAKRRGAGVSLGEVDRYPFDGYFGPKVDTIEIIDGLLSDPSSGFDPPAAFILEVLQGEGGLNLASQAWLRGLQRLCRKHGALLIVDDIQAGCGRVGRFFSFEGMGIDPDIVCLSKSLSGFGLPLAMLMVRDDIDCLDPGEHNGTFRGNNHAFITGRVALQLWSDPKFVEHLQLAIQLLDRRIEGLANTFTSKRLEMRGRGLMRGVKMPDGEMADQACNKAFDRGLVLETCGPHGEVVKLMPPLTVSLAALDTGMDILTDVVSEILEVDSGAADPATLPFPLPVVAKVSLGSQAVAVRGAE